ncbi:MAG: biotin/lipoyl-binding protein [Spirochaetes bacterium]|nr:biotin/lipoyl-binding protein [Spirochaetota bacterium]
MKHSCCHDIAGFILIGGMIALVALAGGCSAGSPAQAGQGSRDAQDGQAPQGQLQDGGRRQAATPVQAVAVTVGLLSADRDTAGVVTPAMQSTVAAQVGGIVSNVLRQVGDWVRQGDIIVQLDDSQLALALVNAQTALDSAKLNLATNQDSSGQANTRLELQVQAAQTAYDSARRTYDGQKALFDLGGISAAALDTAAANVQTTQANLETAKTTLDLNRKGLSTTPGQNIESLKLAVVTAATNLQIARLNLRNASIKAPFGGQISAIGVNPGMFVGQNSSAFTIVSAEKQVNFAVAPADAPALVQGTALDFESGGASFRMKVRYAPSAPVNGLVPMTALPTAGFDLPFGTVGSLSYRIALARGTIVPIAALETLENRNYVFTVEGGTVAIHYVSIVAESGADVALTGIGDKTVVILNAPPGLLQGSSVLAVMTQAAGGRGGGSGPGGETGGAAKQP